MSKKPAYTADDIADLAVAESQRAAEKRGREAAGVHGILKGSSSAARTKTANPRFRGTDSLESGRYFWEFDEPTLMVKAVPKQTVVTILDN